MGFRLKEIGSGQGWIKFFVNFACVVGNKLAKFIFKKLLPVTQVIEKLLGLGFTPTPSLTFRLDPPRGLEIIQLRSICWYECY